jgi:hypothetical protein
MTNSFSPTAAVVIFLACSAAILGLTLLWAIATRKSERPSAPGRRPRRR